MSDQKAYRAKSATFASVALTPVQDMDSDESGQTSDLGGDASPNVTAVFVDQIAGEITINVTDISLANNTSIEVGDAGTLAIVWEQRADGRGAAGSPNKTETWANAVVKGKKRNASGLGGVGSLALTFRAPGSPTWS